MKKYFISIVFSNNSVLSYRLFSFLANSKEEAIGYAYQEFSKDNKEIKNILCLCEDAVPVNLV